MERAADILSKRVKKDIACRLTFWAFIVKYILKIIVQSQIFFAADVASCLPIVIIFFLFSPVFDFLVWNWPKQQNLVQAFEDIGSYDSLDYLQQKTVNQTRMKDYVQSDCMVLCFLFCF